MAFSELIDRIVGRALDYYINEEDFGEEIENENTIIEKLCDIAKKYIQQN